MNIKSFVRKLDVRTPSLEQTVGNLSGGNQQKVSVAKCLAAKVEILIIDEPTVGIDIVQDGDVTFWQGEYGGQTNPRGPLAGKKIACLVGSEFSDFQAYYMASYIGEFGGELKSAVASEPSKVRTTPP
jgi:hypothetical protein